MKVKLTFILVFGLTITSWGQTGDGNCRCPVFDSVAFEPSAIFRLTNGKAIAVCRFVEIDNHEPLFSGFALMECGREEEIGFWEGTTEHRIKTNRDTLIIEELEHLPIGDNFAYEPTVWRIEKLYFKSGQIQREGSFNKQIKKYDQQEIIEVLKEAEAIPGKWQYNNFNIIHKLFIAAISGSTTAREYLTDDTRFEWVDGATTAEGYHDIITALKSWE